MKKFVFAVLMAIILGSWWHTLTKLSLLQEAFEEAVKERLREELLKKCPDTWGWEMGVRKDDRRLEI